MNLPRAQVQPIRLPVLIAQGKEILTGLLMTLLPGGRKHLRQRELLPGATTRPGPQVLRHEGIVPLHVLQAGIAAILPRLQEVTVTAVAEQEAAHLQEVTAVAGQEAIPLPGVTAVCAAVLLQGVAVAAAGQEAARLQEAAVIAV